MDKEVSVAKSIIDLDSLQNLRNQLQGHAYIPGDEEYLQACANWYGTTFILRPAIVVMPVIVADVCAAVSFARAHNLPIGVQSGGHGVSTTADGALLINCARMKKFHIDAQAATVRVEAGVMWRELIPHVQEYGLAPLNGFASTVGVMGYTLGGGFGWLVRQYGLAAHSVRAMEVVTADGRLLYVNEKSHPDLFWGLCGGSGNFGVVTAIGFALYPVKHVFGGSVFYSIETAKKVFSEYLQWIHTIPETLTSCVRLMHFPPSPLLPPMLRGKSFIIVLGCFNGIEAEGASLFEPMRTVGTPLLDTFAQIPYTQIATIANDSVEAPPVACASHCALLKDVTPDTINALVNVASDRDSGLFMVELRHISGAPSRVPENAYAVTIGDANFWLHMLAIAPDDELLEIGRQSLKHIAQSLPAETQPQITLNGMGHGDTSPERVRVAFTPENYRRLVKLKRTYDPQNMFRMNLNIPPLS